MDTLKKTCLNQDKWREIGGYIKKGPFEKEPTEVTVEQLSYDEDTREFTLKVRGVHGNTVYYDVGAEPSAASAEASNPFVTKETDLWFLCVDNSKDDPHPTGEAKHFICTVPLKYEQRTSSVGNVMRLQSHPDFEIRYTTDGSNPKESGGRYTGEFVLPADCKFVLTAVYNSGHLVEEKTIPVTKGPERKTIQINDDTPVSYTMKSMKKCSDTAASYEEKNNTNNYMELNTASVPYDAGNLQATVDLIRDSAFHGKDVIVEFEYKTILFLTGAEFKQWIDMNKLDMNELTKNGEVKQ